MLNLAKLSFFFEKPCIQYRQYLTPSSRRKTLLGQILENILLDPFYHFGTAFELEKIIFVFVREYKFS